MCGRNSDQRNNAASGTIAKLVYVPLILLLLTGTANSSAPGFRDGYPGYHPEAGTRMAADVALSAVQAGVQAYYLIHGHWPQSWALVIEEGIHQAPLPAFAGGTIDPDDPNLDFNGDLHYLPGESGQAQVLEMQDLFGGNTVYSCSLMPPAMTYDDMFNLPLPAGMADEYRPFLQDEEMLRLFAILHCVKDSLLVYRDVHGQVPADWADLCSSGLAPTGLQGVNPVTGQAIRGDGSAGDIYYEKLGPDRYLLHHVNRNGTFPNFLITY